MARSRMTNLFEFPISSQFLVRLGERPISRHSTARDGGTSAERSASRDEVRVRAVYVGPRQFQGALPELPPGHLNGLEVSPKIVFDSVSRTLLIKSFPQLRTGPGASATSRRIRVRADGSMRRIPTASADEASSLLGVDEALASTAIQTTFRFDCGRKSLLLRSDRGARSGYSDVAGEITKKLSLPTKLADRRRPPRRCRFPPRTAVQGRADIITQYIVRA